MHYVKISSENLKNSHYKVFDTEAMAAESLAVKERSISLIKAPLVKAVRKVTKKTFEGKPWMRTNAALTSF